VKIEKNGEIKIEELYFTMITFCVMIITDKNCGFFMGLQKDNII
jgi:hypothetical protein